jgi:hypothetical protein
MGTTLMEQPILPQPLRFEGANYVVPTNGLRFGENISKNQKEIEYAEKIETLQALTQIVDSKLLEAKLMQSELRLKKLQIGKDPSNSKQLTEIETQLAKCNRQIIILQNLSNSDIALDYLSIKNRKMVEAFLANGDSQILFEGPLAIVMGHGNILASKEGVPTHYISINPQSLQRFELYLQATGINKKEIVANGDMVPTNLYIRYLVESGITCNIKLVTCHSELNLIDTEIVSPKGTVVKLEVVGEGNGMRVGALAGGSLYIAEGK